MQATEALQRVLKLAGQAGQYFGTHSGSVEDQQKEFDQNDKAIELCTSFLNTAVPLARFRCFVTIEQVGQKSKLGLGNFTVVCIEIAGIKNGLVGLSMEKVKVYAQLWEHIPGGGFEMLSGYQGDTKCLQFRNWLADIDRFQVDRAPVIANSDASQA